MNLEKVGIKGRINPAFNRQDFQGILPLITSFRKCNRIATLMCLFGIAYTRIMGSLFSDFFYICYCLDGIWGLNFFTKY